jgi:hypothetical protein
LLDCILPRKPTPSVLDGIGGSPRKKFCDLRPTVSSRFLLKEKNCVFLRRPNLSIQIWIQSIRPPFPALLPGPARHPGRNNRPIASPMLFNISDQHFVFSIRPRNFADGSGEAVAAF